MVNVNGNCRGSGIGNGNGIFYSIATQLTVSLVREPHNVARELWLRITAHDWLKSL